MWHDDRGHHHEPVSVSDCFLRSRFSTFKTITGCVLGCGVPGLRRFFRQKNREPHPFPQRTRFGNQSRSRALLLCKRGAPACVMNV